jgi:hypothetical protein
MITSARSRINDTARKEWEAERAKEIEQEKAAAKAADPVLQAQRALDAAAEATRTAILNDVLSEQFLPGERISGRRVNEDAAAQNFKEWASITPSFHKWMADTLLAVYERNDMAPIGANFSTVHNLLLEYGCYEEPVQAAPQPQTVETSTPAEVAVKKYRDDRTIIVVTDPATGQQFTEHALSLLSAVEERRLRRIAEKGHSGNNLMDDFLEIKGIQQEQAAERDRIAAEQMEEK